MDGPKHKMMSMEVKRVVRIVLFLLVGNAFSTGTFAQEALKFVHYSNEDGLPSSYIKDIVQDSYGFMWLANRENVCRFDGYNFKTFPAYNELNHRVNLRTHAFLITADSLIVCQGLDGVFYYFDQAVEAFHPYSILNQLGSIQSMAKPDPQGFWYVKDDQAFHLEEKSGVVVGLEEYFSKYQIGDYVSDLIEFRDGHVAIAAYEPKIMVLDEQQVRHFELPFVGEISMLYFDQYNNLWVGCHDNGLCRIDLDDNSLEFYSSDEEGSQYVSHNMVHCMVEDGDGRLWIGSEDGVSLWTPEQKIFSRQYHDLTNPEGLSSNPIYSSWCDRDGNVWLGTYFSGINLWNSRKGFFKTLYAGVAQGKLGGNVVSCLAEDQEGNVWVGLEDMGLNQIDQKTGVIRKFPIGKEHGGLSYGNLHDLYFEDDEHLWIATYTGGINVLNVKTGKIQYLNSQNTPGLISNNFYAFEGYGDAIYIATGSGVVVFDRKTRMFNPLYPDLFEGILVESICKTEGRIWFSSRIGVHYYDVEHNVLRTLDNTPKLNGINFVKTDSDGRIWIGDSFKGLFLYNEQTDSLRVFNLNEGFPGTWIYSIQEGTNGWFWVATDQGLVKHKPETNESVLFNGDSGVPFSQFNYRATFKDSRGNVYFGSNQGLVYFNEGSSDEFDELANKVIFTGLKLFNQPISPAREGPLERSINMVDEIVLDYEQNVFTIEFSAQNYGNQGKCHYAYYLEGFETAYNYVGNQNFATYTNLSPGSYTFNVKASLNNSNWDGVVNTVQVIVKPPFWLSKWGYLFYLIILGAILVLIYLVGARIQKSKALVQIERNERAHAVELNQIKLEFFTNISHELRTPLTLIIGPLSKLLSDEKVSPTVKNKLSGINLNARRLLELLNQLLEFRKIKRGKEDLKVCETNIGYLFANLEQSFASTAEQNNLKLHFECAKASENVWFDPSKLEKILINLISNAFKFTDPNGVIEVIAKVQESKGNGTIGKVLSITVKDTGRGMESRIVNKVFDRFYQSENAGQSGKNYYGSGIGLAFVQSLVDVHRGTIKVKSKINVGTVFKIEIPASQSNYTAEEISAIDLTPKIVAPVELYDRPESTAQQEEERPEENTNKPKILVVEDNKELIEFIAGSLRQDYNILKASNGAEAMALLADYLVDLILCDVMMPVMDGFEFTTKVKTNIETSHIPVILLTAKSGMDNRFEGLKTGADYYIEKPFMSHILEQNIFNVLNTRKNLIRRFKRDAFMPVSELTHSDSDKEFLDKLTDIIQSNINKPDLDVGFLMHEMGVSRSMLHIKLKKIADCSTTEFINTVRLKEAVKLMADSQCNVSEAAYRTGFSSPTYFTRRFKQYYGQSPREFLQRKLN